MDKYEEDNSTLSTLLHESQMNNQVIWTSDESLLLEQQLRKMEEGDDLLRTVLCLAPLFPHKSIQQISLRIKWMKSKQPITWEEYSQNNDTRYNQAVHRNHSESSSNDGSSMSNSSVSSNLSSPRPPLSDSMSRKSTRTSKSEGCIRSNKRQRQNDLFNSTFDNTINDPIANHKAIQAHKDTVLQNSYELVHQNDQLLMNIENNLYDIENFVELNRELILQFSSNLSQLIDLTEELADPKELPFLPMILNITPDMLTIAEDYFK